MERIDSHQHFWNYHPSRQVWITDNMPGLKKDFSPQDLEIELKKCNLNGCVAVQATQAEEENNYLLNLSANCSFIKGIVGWVDLQSNAINERLAYYKQYEKIKGFRHVIHDEPDIDFMLRPAFINGIKELKKFGFTYDLLIYSHHLPNTIELIKKNQEQLFVIDHIAKPAIKNNEFAYWKQHLSRVAAFPNVYCKISGMVTEASWHQWTKDVFTIYLNAVVELFGTNRIMFGSDWPVCLLSATYEDMYGIVHDYFSTFSKDEQGNFFGLNAKRFYQL